MKSRRDSPTQASINGGDASGHNSLVTDGVQAHEKDQKAGPDRVEDEAEHRPDQQSQRQPRVPIGKITDFDADNNGFVDAHEAVKLARSLGLNSGLPIEVLKKGSIM